MSIENKDYTLTNKDAEALTSILLMDHELRMKLIRKYQKENGVEALQNLFSQFVGMVNSVTENTKQLTDQYLIVHGYKTPEDKTKMNLPTPLGALYGVKTAKLARTDRMCQTCAYRKGTPANQSEGTQCDVDHALNNDQPFYCHEGIHENEEPMQKCIGHQSFIHNPFKGLGF